MKMGAQIRRYLNPQSVQYKRFTEPRNQFPFTVHCCEHQFAIKIISVDFNILLYFILFYCYVVRNYNVLAQTCIMDFTLITISY